MREILFKGKTYNNEWIYGYCYKVRSLLSSDFKWYIRNDYLKDNMVIPKTIGQYTGLKDKNGNKIFEGDLVKHEWDDKLYIVHFKEDRGGYSPFANDGGCGCCCDCDFTGVEGIEIVGNIYDKEVEE